MNEVNFAEVIAQVKKAHGWKGKDLAKVLDVDPSCISKWVRGAWNPNKEAAKKLLEMYREVTSPLDYHVKDIIDTLRTTKLGAPLEAPENLDPLVQKYCEEDTRTAAEIAEEYLKKIKDLEPTEIERLNPPDTKSINQKPIEAGYDRFLENLRFFMKDSRCDTDEKLEMYLNLEPGYISEFGNHSDRFEELTVIGDICDYLGVPWSVLAFSDVAKEERYAKMKFKLQKMEEEYDTLRLEACALGAELGYSETQN